MTDVSVHDNPGANRFEAYVDGELAGSSVYVLSDGQITFTHTEVDDAFEGRGVGGQLAAQALDDVRAQNLHVTAVCPFIKTYIERHPAYADLVQAGS